jgi:hypothetical protein
MASDVDVANLALVHLGDAGRVSSIDPPDSSKHAASCAQFFGIARDNVLTAHPWTFALRRTALSSVEAAIPAYEYAYTLPSSCLRVYRLLQVDSGDEFPGHEYILEGRVLHCNVEGAVLQYVYSAPATVLFPQPVVLAWSYALAALLAGPVLKSAKVAREMSALYLSALDAATARDAPQSTARPVHKPVWLRRRG